MSLHFPKDEAANKECINRKATAATAACNFTIVFFHTSKTPLQPQLSNNCSQPAAGLAFFACPSLHNLSTHTAKAFYFHSGKFYLFDIQFLR